MTLAVPLLRRRGTDCRQEISSSIPSNYLLRSIERADEVAGDEVLSLELIDTKGRRYYTYLGGIVVVVVLIIGLN